MMDSLFITDVWKKNNAEGKKLDLLERVTSENKINTDCMNIEYFLSIGNLWIVNYFMFELN